MKEWLGNLNILSTVGRCRFWSSIDNVQILHAKCVKRTSHFTTYFRNFTQLNINQSFTEHWVPASYSHVKTPIQWIIIENREILDILWGNRLILVKYFKFQRFFLQILWNLLTVQHTKPFQLLHLENQRS